VQFAKTTVGTVQSWFEEHEGGLQHLPWPAQSPDLNIIEEIWSVLETRMKNRFPSSTSLKQLEDVLQEEWYKIPPETVQNLYEFIPEGLRLY
jgi:transposase